MKRNFIEKLICWQQSKSRKPLIVKGVRQVGKTYIISEFGNNHFPKMHYVNFEQNARFSTIFEHDFNPQRIVDVLSFVLDSVININDDLLFFDEIQACPRAVTSLKYFCEQMPQLAICAAGSLLGVHLAPEPFPVGKVDMLHLFPMSFIEFLEAIDDTKSVSFIKNIDRKTRISEIVHAHLWQQMKLYFIVGGLPEAVQTFKDNKDNLYNALQLVREKQKNLIVAYDADIAKHSGKINAMHISRVWHSVPAQLAREQDVSSSRFRFKDVVPGIERYSGLVGAIDWLVAAGLIFKVPIVNMAELPFNAYTKENIFKLYMADVGLLGALSDLNPKTILDYDYGTYKGYFAENFVAQELICSRNVDLYSWQQNRAEIEFLLDIEGDVIPIEVKSGNITRAKSLTIYVDKYRPKYSAIMSGKSFYVDEQHARHYYPLYLASKVLL